MEDRQGRPYSEFLPTVVQEITMPKDSSSLGHASASISVRNLPVRSETPGAGRLPSRWPFTVERSIGLMRSPAADSLPLLVRKESSHFIS
jgi:hypothetical protein